MIRMSIAPEAGEGFTIAVDFSLVCQLRDTRSQRVERLFGGVAEQRIVMTGQGRRDLRPILRFQSSEGGGKEIAIFHHHVPPLVLYEIAKGFDDVLA